MASNSERPFGHDTLKLRAVFVPEDAKDDVSRANISRTLGYHSLKIPAVFVPEGGDRPGLSYQSFGKAIFRRVEDRDDGRTVTAHQPSWQSPGSPSQSPDSVWQSMTASAQSLDSSAQSFEASGQSFDRSAQPPDASWQPPDASSQSYDSAQHGRASDTVLPRSRHRFGSALSDSPPTPPNPTLAGGKSDPVRQGVLVSPGITAAGIAAWRNMANPGKTWRQSLAALAPTQGAHDR